MEKNFELGLVRQVFKLMYEDLIAMTRSNVEIFVSLDDYLNEYIKTEDLDIDNFSAIFWFYFNYCNLVFLTFLFDLSFRLVKRNANGTLKARVRLNNLKAQTVKPIHHYK